MGAGLAVTMRASSGLVRADSSSPWDRATGSPDLPERHSGFVRALAASKPGLDLLRLRATTLPHALGAM
jgi:hypothetical protein